jgi:hypothetical protein
METFNMGIIAIRGEVHCPAFVKEREFHSLSPTVGSWSARYWTRKAVAKWLEMKL